MKNLKQIAAETNRFTLEDVPTAWRHGQYCAHKLARQYDVIPEFLLSLEGYEVGQFFECKIQDEGTAKELYYIGDNVDILVKKKNSDVVIKMSLDFRTKKYTFHPDYKELHKYQNISYYLKKDKLNELKEPNGIGVFTANKVDKWTEYCTDYLNVLKAILTEVDDTNAKIEREIADFCHAIKSANVSKYNNITDVETPLFRVRFTHYKDQKYCNKTIEFRGTIEDVITLQK